LRPTSDIVLSELPLKNPESLVNRDSSGSDFLRFVAVVAVIVGAMTLFFNLQSSAPDSVASAALAALLLLALLAARRVGGPTAALIREGVKGALIVGAAVGISAAVGKLLHPEMSRREGVIGYAVSHAEMMMFAGALWGAMEGMYIRHPTTPLRLAWVIGALTVAACGRAFFGPWAGGAIGVGALTGIVGAGCLQSTDNGTGVQPPAPPGPLTRIFLGGLVGLFYGLFSNLFLSIIGLEPVHSGSGHERPEGFWVAVITLGALLGTAILVMREARNPGLPAPDDHLSTADGEGAK
jgi:hypothetical protein